MDSRAQKLWQRGLSNFQAGNWEAAQANFETFLAREPGSASGRFRLSMVHARRGRFIAAIELAQEALAAEPDRIELLTHLSRCHLSDGRPEDARVLATRALAMPRDKPLVLDSLGVIMTRLNEQALAIELFDQAIALEPKLASIYFNRALAERQFGLFDAAERDLEQCLALSPGHGKAHWILAGLRTQDLVSNHVPRLRSQMQQATEIGVDTELPALALFKELDDLSDIDGAGSALVHAVACRSERGAAVLRNQRGLTDTMINIAGKKPFPPRTAMKPGVAPVFIFGMPRSGVALLGNLLSRHSKIHHLGFQDAFSRLLSRQLGRDSRQALGADAFEQCRELDFDELGRRYLAAVTSAEGKQLIICESQPMHYQLAGILARALPGARMLNMVRDPLDNCLAILAQPSGELILPTHDPAELAAGYLEYHRLMQQWHKLFPDRIMDVNYESLVEKPEMVIRVICSFLGIRYGSSLRTGLQLHQRSIGRGARYASFLPTLRSGLAPLAG